VQLDRLGIIELRPLNRYRLKLAKTFRWRPHGPVMHYFREHAVLDYFRRLRPPTTSRCCWCTAPSAAPGALLHRPPAAGGAGLRAAHQADQKLPQQHREGYTLVLAMRSWDFEGFEALRRR
jgi:hypothetical protein